MRTGHADTSVDANHFVGTGCRDKSRIAGTGAFRPGNNPDLAKSALAQDRVLLFSSARDWVSGDRAGFPSTIPARCVLDLPCVPHHICIAANEIFLAIRRAL